MNTTTAITENTILTIAGHQVVVRRVDTIDGEQVITMATVLDPKGRGIDSGDYLGMIIRHDATTWGISAGHGWIDGEDQDGFHEAIARVIELRAKIDAQVVKFHRLHRDCGKRNRAAVLDLFRSHAQQTYSLVANHAARTVLFDAANPAYAGRLAPVALRRGELLVS